MYIYIYILKTPSGVTSAHPRIKRVEGSKSFESRFVGSLLCLSCAVSVWPEDGMHVRKMVTRGANKTMEINMLNGVYT